MPGWVLNRKKQTMNRSAAKVYIDSHPELYFKRANDGKSWVCPICGSGSHSAKGDGLTTKDGVHYTCWRGCFETPDHKGADIIDIIGKVYGLTDYNSKLERAAQICNIELDPLQHEASPLKDTDSTTQHTQDTIHNTDNTIGNAQDYTAFFLQANRDIDKTGYHRGLSMETINRFKIGYVANWKHPKAPPKVPASPHLIIPTSPSSYLARAIDPSTPKEYKKMKVGEVHLFNPRALEQEEKPVMIVEGELDALSIIDVGGEALALGSTSNIGKLIDLLKKHRPTKPLIIALDNDEAGRKKTEDLINGLKDLGIPFYYIPDLYGQHKDANEILMTDREELQRIVARAMNIEQEELEKESAAYNLQSFIDNVTSSKTAPFFPTGFKSLDKILDGGLYAGLYIVGAISSLGKTTFCLQVADQIAQQGNDVLIFSLEMARDELMAKSISRLTLLKDLENGSTAHAKTTRGIMTGTRYKYYSPEEQELIANATVAYGEYANHIYITEGVGNVGIDEIKAKVAQHIRVFHNKPVVLIDYLQIIAPTDMRASDKQNTDRAVLELKRLSRDYGIPVIGISSFNRENYTSPVSMTAFKESGAIEYSSDLLIGLQYNDMDYEEGESVKAREKRIRDLIKKNVSRSARGEAIEIQVKILKNRNGGKGDALLYFYPMFNFFTEDAPDRSGDLHKINSSYE